MLLSKSHQLRCRAPLRSSNARAPPKALPVQCVSRRDLLIATGITLVASQHGPASAADLSALNNTAAATADAGGFISITPINKSAKEVLDRRDDAMEYKCKGGMFDCDGDRREFAHKQYQEWLDAGGVPKRIRDGKPEGPRAF